MWMRYSQIARKRQVQPSTHTVTVNRRAYWGREVVDYPHEPLSHQREIKRIAAQHRNFIEIGSGGEELLAPGDDERSGVLL